MKGDDVGTVSKDREEQRRGEEGGMGRGAASPPPMRHPLSPPSLLDSPLAVVEVTAIAGVALHLQLALAMQGVTGDLQAERPCWVSGTYPLCAHSFSPHREQSCT